MEEILIIFGKIAGIGGLAIGVLLLLYRDILSKNIFPNLTKEQGYKIIRLIIFVVWSVAILGMAAWVFLSINSTNGEKESGNKKVLEITPTRFSDQQPNVEIHITEHYRSRFKFSLVSNENTHWVVNRLYLKYLSEYDWEPIITKQEALSFRTNYEIVLSNLFSEYDLIPLTLDNEIHAFEYNGRDSDHFGVQLYGTYVSKVQIVAEVYDFKSGSKKPFEIKSKELEIVVSPDIKPLWDKPIHIRQEKLIEYITPLAYKTITHLNWEDFIYEIKKDKPHQFESLKKDISKFLSSFQYMKNQYIQTKGKKQEQEQYAMLEEKFEKNPDSLNEKELEKLAFIKSETAKGNHVFSESSLEKHVREILLFLEKLKK